MARKFLFYAERAILSAVQLFIFGYSLAGFLPASAQTGQHATESSSAKLGAFLAEYPKSKSPDQVEAAHISALGEGALVGYRKIKEPKKASIYISDKAYDSFRAECSAIGGQIARFDNPAEIARYYEMARGLSLSNGNPPLVCVGAEELPLGAVFAHTSADRYKNRYSVMFVLTQEAATEMVVMYHRGKAKELRFQADIGEKQAAYEQRWTDWRAKLAVGSETHCGPILELRGPVVQVAYGTQAGWVRRERLYPPQDVSRCWEFSGL